VRRATSKKRYEEEVDVGGTEKDQSSSDQCVRQLWKGPGKLLDPHVSCHMARPKGKSRLKKVEAKRQPAEGYTAQIAAGAKHDPTRRGAPPQKYSPLTINTDCLTVWKVSSQRKGHPFMTGGVPETVKK